MIENHIQLLHNAWCSATGQELHLRATERIFYELHQLEFTPDDIRTVVSHLKSLNSKSDMKFSLRANRVLGDIEFFSSTLAEAVAIQRNKRPAPTAREQVQNMRERAVDPEQSSVNRLTLPRSFQDVLNKMKVGEG